jgi:hypothetical protein
MAYSVEGPKKLNISGIQICIQTALDHESLGQVCTFGEITLDKIISRHSLLKCPAILFPGW